MHRKGFTTEHPKIPKGFFRISFSIQVPGGPAGHDTFMIHSDRNNVLRRPTFKDLCRNIMLQVFYIHLKVIKFSLKSFPNPKPALY
jgi:hypothetical protein